jgi:hypothetical protein
VGSGTLARGGALRQRPHSCLEPEWSSQVSHMQGAVGAGTLAPGRSSTSQATQLSGARVVKSDKPYSWDPCPGRSSTFKSKQSVNLSLYRIRNTGNEERRRSRCSGILIF